MTTLPGSIAIDGPAASGKSTLALKLAASMGYLYFDTGVMYRAVTQAAIQRRLNLQDEAQVTTLAQSIQIDVRQPSQDDGRACDVLVDGQDITWATREAEVERHVSLVSAYAGVRAALTEQQRRVGQRGKVIMVGRDIGTVVMPDADLKIYLDASAEERARRRAAELQERGGSANYELILKEMRERDRKDSSRAVAPLRPAADAHILQSDGLNAEQVLELCRLWVQHAASLSSQLAQPISWGDGNASESAAVPAAGPRPHFALLTILTSDVPRLAAFYRDQLGFQVQQDLGQYVEFIHPGIRFSICSRQVMFEATGHPSYRQPVSGQRLELALPVASPQDVDRVFAHLTLKGVRPVALPANMPWNQRTAFFADPDGNIHELFADLPHRAE